MQHNVRRNGRVVGGWRGSMMVAALSVVACGGTGLSSDDPDGDDPLAGATWSYDGGLWTKADTSSTGGSAGSGCGSVQYVCSFDDEHIYAWEDIPDCQGEPYDTYWFDCDGREILLKRGGQVGEIVLDAAGGAPADYGTGGAAVGGGGTVDDGTGGMAVGGGTGGSSSAPAPGANRCGFEYASCVELALESCDAMSNECSSAVGSCQEQHNRCVLDAPSCDNQVSNCFATAESCLIELPDSDICSGHYDFCITLATQCQDR